MGKIVVVLGSGARQHAIAWKLKQSVNVSKVFSVSSEKCAFPEIECIEIKLHDFEKIEEFCKEKKVDYLVTGGGEMLNSGIVDYFQSRGMKIFGPTKAAALLEGSKTFGKQFMQKHNIPTPQYGSFTSLTKAKEYVMNLDEGPVVVKADGLVNGRGVVVCDSKSEAVDTLEEMMLNTALDSYSNTVVIEEYVEGPEVSVHVLYDGKSHYVFPLSQDHKPLYDGNRGPNTGGMGTYSPLDWIDDETLEEINRKIVIPTLEGMKKEGINFKGLLFPGLMLTKKGPMLLEYNTRFGAPETQSYVMLLESDLDDIFEAVIEGRLSDCRIRWKQGYAVTVETVAAEYPEKLVSDEMQPLTLEPGSAFEGKYFFGGVTEVDGQFNATGSKVVSVSVFASTLELALKQAYLGVSKVNFKGKKYRRDIGKLQNVIGKSNTKK